MKLPKPVEFAYYVGIGTLLGVVLANPYGYGWLGACIGALTMALLEGRELLLSTSIFGNAYNGWRYRKEPFWKRLALEWKYREHDDNICCCGAYIGQGGEICYHGGCRSQKEYVITESMK